MLRHGLVFLKSGSSQLTMYSVLLKLAHCAVGRRQSTHQIANSLSFNMTGKCIQGGGSHSTSAFYPKTSSFPLSRRDSCLGRRPAEALLAFPELYVPLLRPGHDCLSQIRSEWCQLRRGNQECYSAQTVQRLARGSGIVLGNQSRTGVDL